MTLSEPDVIPAAEAFPGTLSVIIITRDEEKNIKDCLESLTWADEIIVVDSGSSDDTIEICKSYTDNVTLSDWSGFGRQKNKALDLATSEWVLSIDADERVNPALQREIKSRIADANAADAFYIPRRSSYCGRMMRHSGWYPDYVLRLFRRQQGRFSDDLVHEKVLTSAKVEKLANPLMHYPMDTFEQAIDKMNLYSTLAARDQFDAGKNSSLFKAMSRGLWTFIRVYFLKRGFLDGPQGFMLAISNAGGTYYKYVKLARLIRIANGQ
jgi:glycosyltransferase involved in cell wall biosynthesis